MPYGTRGYGMGTYMATGDPFLGGILKGALKIGKGFVTGGPLGAIGAGVGILTGGKRAPAPPAVRLPMQMPVSMAPQQRFPTRPPRPGQMPGPPTPPGYGRKRRRMNPGNAKALRRAIRRQDAFVKLARGALKGSGYKIVSKGAGRSTRRDLPPGHTHVR